MHVVPSLDPGSPRVRFGAEIRRLRESAELARRPAVFIQVVDPECVAGLAGAFMIAKLPNDQPDVVSSDSPTQAHITTDHDIVASIWQRYEAIRLWAYPERASLKMIEETDAHGPERRRVAKVIAVFGQRRPVR